MEKLTLEQQAVVNVIRRAIAFADLMAGEGFSTFDASIPDPADFLHEYLCISGDADGEKLADHIAERVCAALAKEQRE